MKIDFDTTIYLSNKNNYSTSEIKKNNKSLILSKNVEVPNSYVYFRAYVQPQMKKLNTEIETKKLIKQIIQAIDDNIVELPYETASKVLNKSVNIYIQKANAYKEKDKFIDYIDKKEHLSDVERSNALAIIKEMKTLEKQLKSLKVKILELNDVHELYTSKLNGDESDKSLDKLEAKMKKITENLAKIIGIELKKKSTNNNLEDVILLNKFRHAIEDDNIDLKEIFNKYYKHLNEINHVEVLKSIYPHIQIPPNPTKVIASKFIETMTKEQIEIMDYLINNDQKKVLEVYLYKVIKDFSNKTAEKFNIDAVEFFDKINGPILEASANKYMELKRIGSFNSMPEFVKNTYPKITEEDIKLLQYDYDDFITSVVKKIYLGNEKYDDIYYEKLDENTNKVNRINIKNLKSTAYKFSPKSKKIEQFIQMAERIKVASRDYDNFNEIELKNRLNYYLNSNVINDEFLVEKIAEFEYSKFLDADILNLKKMLRLFDKLKDKELKERDVIEKIKKDNIHPVGTIELDNQQRLENLQKIKLERSKNFEIQTNKERFNSAIDLLYANELGSLVDLLEKYSPKSLDEDVLSKSNEVINFINTYLNEDKIDKMGKDKLTHVLTCYDKYNELNNFDKVLQNKALEFGTLNNNVDKIKVGLYLKNAELYDQIKLSNTDLYENAKIFKLIDSFDLSNDEKIKLMCKYDEYFYLDEKKNMKLTDIISIFNINDTTEKIILKNIIEDDYITNDSIIYLKKELNDKDEKVTIKSNVKNDIYEYYSFPLCVDIFKKFEHASTKYSREKDNEGIKIYNKKVGSHIQTVMELKIKGTGFTDRIFSSNADYTFDVYSKDGTNGNNNHKMKKK